MIRIFRNYGLRVVRIFFLWPLMKYMRTVDAGWYMEAYFVLVDAAWEHNIIHPLIRRCYAALYGPMMGSVTGSICCLVWCVDWFDTMVGLVVTLNGVTGVVVKLVLHKIASPQ